MTYRSLARKGLFLICLAGAMDAAAGAERIEADVAAIKDLIGSYARSVDAADTNLASTIWANSADVSMIHPRGHEHGWEAIRTNVYQKAMRDPFSERKLAVEDVVVHAYGDAAWAEFNLTVDLKALAGPKTSSGERNASFLGSVADEKRRQDCRTVLEIMKKATRAEPKMWGASMVGLGSYHYRYSSGREGDWFVTGFSPRKDNLTLYVMSGFDRYAALMRKLGKYKTGKSCLYIKKLADVDLSVLEELIQESVEHVARERS